MSNMLLDIPIAGINLTSTIDYPGHISAILFTLGCPWRCWYCHNKEFIYPRSESGETVPVYDNDTVERLLLERKGLIDSVVISGGEPTMHECLPDVFRNIRNAGFGTCLHTNGFGFPLIAEMLRGELIDYIALDIKRSYSSGTIGYHKLTKQADAAFQIIMAVDMIGKYKPQGEARTTYHQDIMSVSELRDCMELARDVFDNYYIQKAKIPFHTPCKDIPEEIIKTGNEWFEHFGVRG